MKARKSIPQALKEELLVTCGYKCSMSKCNVPESLEFHHINGNPMDNRKQNVIVFCAVHHHQADIGKISRKACVLIKKLLRAPEAPLLKNMEELRFLYCRFLGASDFKTIEIGFENTGVAPVEIQEVQIDGKLFDLKKASLRKPFDATRLLTNQDGRLRLSYNWKCREEYNIRFITVRGNDFQHIAVSPTSEEMLQVLKCEFSGEKNKKIVKIFFKNTGTKRVGIRIVLLGGFHYDLKDSPWLWDQVETSVPDVGEIGTLELHFDWEPKKKYELVLVTRADNPFHFVVEAP